MKLKVGDKVYQTYRGVPKSIMVIDRVTKTQAISGNVKFKIEFSNSRFISRIAGDSYHMYSYILETPELKDRLIKLKLIQRVKNIEFEKLSKNQLQKILNVYNESK